jgi:hypothetical protein
MEMDLKICCLKFGKEQRREEGEKKGGGLHLLYANSKIQSATPLTSEREGGVSTNKQP